MVKPRKELQWKRSVLSAQHGHGTKAPIDSLNPTLEAVQASGFRAKLGLEGLGFCGLGVLGFCRSTRHLNHTLFCCLAFFFLGLGGGEIRDSSPKPGDSQREDSSRSGSTVMRFLHGGLDLSCFWGGGAEVHGPRFAVY